jgi:hypothetical protein
MIRFLLPAVLGMMLSACNSQTVKIDVDFAKTNYGFLNSGGYRPGSLLLWNIKESTLSYKGQVECSPPGGDPGSPSDIETQYEFSLEANLDLTPAQIAAIESAVKTRSSLVAKDSRRFQCKSILTSLSNSVIADPTVLEDWSFREAARDPNLYYLVVTDVTIGDSVELTVDNQVMAKAGFPLKIGSSTFNASIAGNGLGKISGNDVLLMFNVRAFRPTFIDNGAGGQNAAFEPKSGLDLRKLKTLLRRVGDSS